MGDLVQSCLHIFSVLFHKVALHLHACSAKIHILVHQNNKQGAKKNHVAVDQRSDKKVSHIWCPGSNMCLALFMKAEVSYSPSPQHKYVPKSCRNSCDRLEKSMMTTVMWIGVEHVAGTIKAKNMWLESVKAWEVHESCSYLLRI